MKKLLTVSVLAIMAVSTANAEIASTQYVNTQTGAGVDGKIVYTGQNYITSDNLKGATEQLDAAIKGVADNVGNTNVADQISAAIEGATIGQDQVSGLGDTLDGKQDLLDSTNVVTDGTGNVITEISAVDGVVTATKGMALGTLATQNTVTQAQVDGLTTALAGKADSATTLSGYGITDAYTKTEVDGKVANMEVTTNRTSNITQSLNDGNSTAYPTVGAVKTYLDDRFTLNEYSGEEGVNVNNLNHTITLTDNAVDGEKLKDDTVTSAKLAPAVRTDIAKGVAADTLSQQNKAAIEALPTTYASKTTVETAYQDAINTAEADAVAAAKTETTNQVNALKNTEVKANADAIAGMDATYAAQEGKYIASVTQADGKVTATYADLTDVAKMEVPEVCNGTATCALVWNKNTKTLDWEAIMQ